MNHITISKELTTHVKFPFGPVFNAMYNDQFFYKSTFYIQCSLLPRLTICCLIRPNCYFFFQVCLSFNIDTIILLSLYA